MRNRGERRGVEAKRKRGDRRAKKGMGRGVTVSSTGGTTGVVLRDDLVDGSGKVDEKILFDVTGAASKLGVEGTCEKGNVVNEREEAGTNATKGFNNAWDDRFALGGGIASEFVLFTGGGGKAGSGKGSCCIPCSQRVPDRSVQKKLLTCGEMSDNIHYGVNGVEGFLRVCVAFIVCGELCGELLELGYGDLALDEGTRVLERSGEKHGDGSVEKGNATPNFAREWVKVVCRSSADFARPGFVLAGR